VRAGVGDSEKLGPHKFKTRRITDYDITDLNLDLGGPPEYLVVRQIVVRDPMKSIDKLMEKLYEETDAARSIATSLAGVAGLVIYLVSSDWVVALFAWLIVFPLARLITAAIHAKRSKRATRRDAENEAKELYGRLSAGEKKVVRAFVTAGGTVMTWAHMNSLSLPGPSVESLMHRELLSTSVTADGMSETFVLDPALFDAAGDIGGNVGAP
jgi:ABC-type multidrug transport system fused ATPase/permease subunit